MYIFVDMNFLSFFFSRFSTGGQLQSLITHIVHFNSWRFTCIWICAQHRSCFTQQTQSIIFFKLKGGRPIPKTFLRGKKMIRRFWRGGRRKKILWIVQYTENRFKFGILFSSHYIRQNPKKKPSHIRPAEWLFVKGMGIEGVVTRPFFGNFKHT